MSLAIYILRNYMSTLPKEVIESAKIDGASHYQTFCRLVLPMSVPALASFAIFQFLWVWNDLLVALVFIGPGENEPITVTVTHLLSDQGHGWNLVTAGGFFSMIVPIVGVPVAAALLRPRSDRRFGQGLSEHDEPQPTVRSRPPRWGVRTVGWLSLAIVATLVQQIQGHFTIITLTGLLLGFGGASYCTVQGVRDVVRGSRG